MLLYPLWLKKFQPTHQICNSILSSWNLKKSRNYIPEKIFDEKSWFFTSTIGVNIQNLKVNFKTGGTWCWVRQWSLIMNIYDFFIWLSRLVTKCQRINKNREDRRFLFIRRHFVTKQLSRIKKIINIQYQWSL